jgi:non-ribosomal peptide synthetase-like protein
LHELFELQVDRDPACVALSCGDRCWDYGELDKVANRLARLLSGAGAGPGRFVAVYLQRGELPIIAVLACLKAGAAYVPIDPSYPVERIRHIAEELEPIVCLTDAALESGARAVFGSAVTVLDAVEDLTAGYPSQRLDRERTGVLPEHLAYVIYTSGSTGRPKGVMVEHGSAAFYVQAFNEVCATGLDDRVFQGFSLSFDGSVEEIWMAFSNGSELVVPGVDVPRFGDDLGVYLAGHGVTYLSTVPTMLSTITADVPSLRTIVLSGEVCPPELVARWARPGRRVFNVYGPTEATVNTTALECHPGAEVTIGRPLPGYRLHVVDEELRPVPEGEAGELLVSGRTLARGYSARPDLTAERFLDVTIGGEEVRCYRTGDVVRRGQDGELTFHGRMDAQVKIRGYRVELSEIEAVLAEDPQIGAAAVAVRDRDGFAQLAAYVTARTAPGGQPVDHGPIRTLLESRLPAYMVPAFLETLPELPRLTSGKVDRNLLPDPVTPLRRTAIRRSVNTPMQRRIAQVWCEVLGVGEVCADEDFFTDLGGYSLLAARAVTLLRERLGCSVAVRDLYECPTVEQLAARVSAGPDGGGLGAGPGAGAEQFACVSRARSAREVFGTVPRRRRWSTYLMQVLALFLLAAVPALPFSILVLMSLRWVDGEASTQTAVMVWLLLPLAVWVVMLVTSIASKWLIIGRYRPGEHPLWGGYYARWWLCNRLQALSGVGLLVGTPLLPLYFRLMGARVGPRCTLDTAQVGAWDLIRIGADTSIGADTQLPGYRVENGMLRLGRVDVGQGCFIGLHSALGLDVRMEDRARLDDQSLLADGEVIPADEGRHGSPSSPAPVRVPEAAAPEATARRFGFGLAHVVAAQMLGLVALVPGLAYLLGFLWAYHSGGGFGLVLALIAGAPLGVVTTAVYLAVVRRAVLPRMRPGSYRVCSWLYVRKWLSDGLMKGARAALLPVYTTLYLPPWLRLMGARIGPRAELSTVWSFAPELVEVEAESFFADGSIVGGRRAYRGTFQVGRNRIGRRSFVGNGAVLPMGASLGDGCLLGVQSITPTNRPETADGTEWLGSPPFRLTHRPVVGDFDLNVTFRPGARLYVERTIVDTARILIPAYLGLISVVGFVVGLVQAQRLWGTGSALALAPVLSLAFQVFAVLVVAGLKKVVMGTFTPQIKPLWSRYVWLNEMVNGAYESVTAPIASSLLGTPMAAVVLRLMGCRIGRHTYLATTLMSEFDLVEIGDYAALNQGVVIQNHLFEDRVFKSSHLSIGPEVSIGNMTVILYDTKVETGANVGPLSLLMKGETLAERTTWRGIPTAPTTTDQQTANHTDAVDTHDIITMTDTDEAIILTDTETGLDPLSGQGTTNSPC